MSGKDLDFETLRAVVAAWSLVHGSPPSTTTMPSPAEPGDDPESIAKSVAAYLFRSRRT
jgi:hypothetical protein